MRLHLAEGARASCCVPSASLPGCGLRGRPGQAARWVCGAFSRGEGREAGLPGLPGRPGSGDGLRGWDVPDTGATVGERGGEDLRSGRCYHPREGGFWLFGEQGAGSTRLWAGNTCRKWDDPTRPRERGPRECASDGAPDAGLTDSSASDALWRFCVSEGDGGRVFTWPFYAFNALAVLFQN